MSAPVRRSAGFDLSDCESHASFDIEFDDPVADIEDFKYICVPLEDVDKLLAIQVPTTIITCLCKTCFEDLPSEQFRSLDCGHRFCANCWIFFLGAQIGEGRSIEIFCMDQACEIVVPMEFVLQLLGSGNEHLKSQYMMLYREERIRNSSRLLFCPGVDCQAVIKVKRVKAKPVVCSFCKTLFCCRCREPYHAPASCETMKEWVERRAAHENTSYVLSRTKNCPKCGVPIEKNGGCDHMTCSRCGYDFCWLCGDFFNVNARQHSCNRDVESAYPSPETFEARQAQHEKFLFYCGRWDAHAQSLRLEKNMRDRFVRFIEGRIADGEGTFESWEHLLDAANLLRKCRYTLQHSYPHAYSLEAGPPKEVLEFQQSQLEAETESLSSQLERAEWTTRDEFVQQMSLAEERRRALLKEWFRP